MSTMLSRLSLLTFIAIFTAAPVAAEPSPAEYASRLAVLERGLTSDAENLSLAAEYRQLAIATGSYDRAIKFLGGLARRPDAGPYASLSLALAYVDKVPVSSAIRRLYLGRDAIAALTRSIEREPSDFAYMVRGIINLYYDTVVFRRTAKGVADLEEARRLAATHLQQPYVERIFVALGDGYWRLKNATKAREVWREGLAHFPAAELLSARVSATDDIVRGLIAHSLDPDIRVDTTLRDVLPDPRTPVAHR